MIHEEMSPEEAAKRCIMDSGVQVAKMWGMSDAAGALRGALILADGPMSMDELVEETGYSKSTVSTNMTFLEDQGVVRRVRKAGDKKNYYVAMQNIDEAFKAENEKIKQIMHILLAAIDEAESILDDAERSKEVERLCHCFNSMREECTKVQKLIDLVRPFTVDELIKIMEQETKARSEEKVRESKARETSER